MINKDETANTGELGIFNTAKGISEIILNILNRHDKAFVMARQGYLDGMNRPTSNEIVMNKIRGLLMIINAQCDLIKEASSTIISPCKSDWEKNNKTQEEREDNPFSKENNDFTKLEGIRDILYFAEDQIIKADETSTLTDDFKKTIYTEQGEIIKTTQRHRTFIRDFEKTYIQIREITDSNKITSSGIIEDDYKVYDELEDKTIARFASS